MKMDSNHVDTMRYRSGDTGRLWRAVSARDRHADGEFVYAVLSTGVYCRPSCPAKRPKSEKKVTFFALPEAAERAGFRPCKRCSPRMAGPADPTLRAVASVCRSITDRLLADEGHGEGDGGLALAGLAAGAGVSPHQLERMFRRIIGITPRQYADTRRMLHLKSALRKGDSVTSAIYNAGFGSSSRLYERANAQLGMTPATYGRGGAGMRIVYTTAETPLGKMLLAATERGISALYLGKSTSSLEEALREEYPRAELICERKASGRLTAWLGEVLAHLNGRRPHLDLPTDVQATAFQRLVWEELRRIPYGSTRTYTEVAKAIGKRSAVRAVARACATNPVSVVVPCHRVIRQGGELAGYRWGLDRKRNLLDHEAANSKK